MADKYLAVWVSHSTMGDYLKCPKLYFLKNVYRNDKGRKISVVGPALSLGQAVHGAVEGLGRFKSEDRMSVPLLKEFEKEWAKVSGKKGGFRSMEEEQETKKRGIEMILRVVNNPGPLLKKTVKLKDGHNGMPPNFYISEPDNIILCGKIDWLEYVPEDDSIKVIDFKTGKYDEDGDSLQLPIYRLLLEALQKRKVSGAAYWYLDREDLPRPVNLPDSESARKAVLVTALKVKKAREAKEFTCPRGDRGCFGCRPYEAVLGGEAEFVGLGEYGQEMYVSK